MLKDDNVTLKIESATDGQSVLIVSQRSMYQSSIPGKKSKFRGTRHFWTERDISSIQTYLSAKYFFPVLAKVEVFLSFDFKILPNIEENLEKVFLFFPLSLTVVKS